MANCVGICNANYIDVAANIFEGSENIIYPVENAFDLNKRKKVYRTGGYWDLRTVDTTIVFRESVGVDLTATVVAAEYNSTSDFLIAIEAALEAAGASNYSVTAGVSGKVTIASDGAGGGGILQLMWTDSASADMADILGFDTASNSTGALSYVADILRIHTNEQIIFDLGFPSNPKAFVAVGERNLPLKISSGAVVKVQGNHTNNFSSPAVDLTVEYEDFALATWDVDGLGGTNSYRYWRFYIEDKSNVRQYLEFNAMYLGDMHEATRGCVVFPLETSKIDNSQIIYSEHGQVFSREIPKTQSVRLGWELLRKEEVESLNEHWENVGLTESFFVILDLPEAFTTQKEKSVMLVKFESEISTRLVSPNNFQMAWQLREQL